jgi:hypothetical protein
METTRPVVRALRAALMGLVGAAVGGALAFAGGLAANLLGMILERVRTDR